jgi:thiamine biosynthesis lipoprotein
VTAGRQSIIAFGLSAAMIGAGCSTPAEPRIAAPVERAEVAMGSEVRFIAWTADEAAALSAFDEAFGEFQRLDALLSVWREGSDVQRLNHAAGVAPVAVADETLEVLAAAIEMGGLTKGKFDVTFATLSDVWKFDHDQDNTIPPPAAIQERLRFVDYQSLSIDATRKTAFVARRGIRVHLGGIGKGYAVDRAVTIFKRRGLNDFMIRAGGDMYVAGHRGDRSWRLGIQDPRGPAEAIFAAIDLADAALSTSGDYERFFIKDGRRFHHIIDPDRGEPAVGCRSVTIVANRSTTADALSTGAFVLGPAEGMALIERLPNAEGVIVTADNEVLVSSGLKDRLTIVAPPTDRRP